MYRSILVGFDGSEQAQDALACARMLARTLDAELTLVRVTPYEPLLSEVATPPPTQLGAQREAAHEELLELARSLGLPAEAVESSSPARGLHEAAERLGADLVVVGSSHRGPIGRVLAGNVGRSLLNGSPCAVAVTPRGHRPEPDEAPRLVEVGFDGSPEARDALAAAAEVGKRAGATVRVIGAVSTNAIVFGGPWTVADPELPRLRREQLQGEMEEAVDGLPGDLRPDGRVIDGEPVTVLLDEAGKGVELLFVGSRGYGRLRGVLLGSVSAELIHSAPCPVVVHPRGTHHPNG